MNSIIRILSCGFIKISTLVFLITGTYAFGQKDSPLVASGAKLTLVAEEFKFTEGPASDRQGNIYFTDQPNDRILKWTASNNSIEEYLKPAGRSNGLYVDDSGNLLACADEKFQLWRIDVDKNVSVLINDYKGQKLNGPNDLWIHKNGNIYLTDPYYQRPWWKREQGELPYKCVFYFSPESGDVQIVADDFIKPNGIIGSSDGKTLYVADRGANKTYSFKIKKNGKLSNKQLFINRDSDGMTTDERGNVYVTGEKGVYVFTKEGKEILHIPIEKKWTSNVTFGGVDQKTLFITAMNAVYTLQMNVKGVRW